MTQKKLAVTALLYNELGEILLVSRKDNHADFGLPGGKVDEGETLEQAIIREVQKETGLELSNLRPIFNREDGEYHCTTFTGDHTGTIQTPEKGVVKWSTFEELKRGCFGEYNALLEKSLSN